MMLRLFFIFTLWIESSHAFVSRTQRNRAFSKRGVISALFESNVATSETNNHNDSELERSGDERLAVRAPLKFVGPYPSIGLQFPNLATASQRNRNVSGISLDFILDTAANTNTINGQVAIELELEQVGEAPGGLGAGGAIQGGTTFMLGDCELEGIPKEEQFTFVQGLTASALPVASPAAAGLLSLQFFHCFEGGVEFQWGGENKNQSSLPPSVTFFGFGESEEILKDMTKISLKELPVTRLPSVEVTINGVKIPALFDTGSPVTVLNSQAAEKVGVTTMEIPETSSKNGGNFLANIANRFQEAKAAVQAAARGELLSIAGTRGERVDLIKSKEKAGITLTGSSAEEKVDFGSSHVYIGNIPGLAALDALGDDSPPAAVLGMDVLRLRPKMLLRVRDNEVYF